MVARVKPSGVQHLTHLWAVHTVFYGLTVCADTLALLPNRMCMMSMSLGVPAFRV